jgi:hypothetical protein
LNTQNNFYKFLKLAVILQKGKIGLLKNKRETGRSGGHWLGRPRSVACPGLARPNHYAAIVFPTEACTRACVDCAG